MSFKVNATGCSVVVTSEDFHGKTRTYDFARGEYALQPTADGYTSGVLKALWQTGHVVEWSPDDIRGPVDLDSHVRVRDVTGENELAEFL